MMTPPPWIALICLRALLKSSKLNGYFWPSKAQASSAEVHAETSPKGETYDGHIKGKGTGRSIGK
eukprot:2420590-Pyramimonas_sp.AAC.1